MKTLYFVFRSINLPKLSANCLNFNILCFWPFSSKKREKSDAPVSTTYTNMHIRTAHRWYIYKSLFIQMIHTKHRQLFCFFISISIPLTIPVVQYNFFRIVPFLQSFCHSISKPLRVFIHKSLIRFCFLSLYLWISIQFTSNQSTVTTN